MKGVSRLNPKMDEIVESICSRDFCVPSKCTFYLYIYPRTLNYLLLSLAMRLLT